MGKKKILVAFLFMTVMVFGFMTSTASAVPYAFDVGVPSAGLSSYVGPYAHWEINLLDNTHANITVSALTNGSQSFLLGDGGSVALNVNAGSFAVSDWPELIPIGEYGQFYHPRNK